MAKDKHIKPEKPRRRKSPSSILPAMEEDNKPEKPKRGKSSSSILPLMADGNHHSRPEKPRRRKSSSSILPANEKLPTTTTQKPRRGKSSSSFIRSMAATTQNPGEPTSEPTKPMSHRGATENEYSSHKRSRHPQPREYSTHHRRSAGRSRSRPRQSSQPRQSSSPKRKRSQSTRRRRIGSPQVSSESSSHHSEVSSLGVQTHSSDKISLSQDVRDKDEELRDKLYLCAAVQKGFEVSVNVRAAAAKRKQLSLRRIKPGSAGAKEQQQAAVVLWSRNSKRFNQYLRLHKRKKRKEAILLLQRWFRGCQGRKTFANMHEAAELFYFPRSVPERNRPLSLYFALRVTLTIQRYWRGYWHKCWVHREKKNLLRVRFVRAELYPVQAGPGNQTVPSWNKSAPKRNRWGDALEVGKDEDTNNKDDGMGQPSKFNTEDDVDAYAANSTDETTAVTAETASEIDSCFTKNTEYEDAAISSWEQLMHCSPKRTKMKRRPHQHHTPEMAKALRNQPEPGQSSTTGDFDLWDNINSPKDGLSRSSPIQHSNPNQRHILRSHSAHNRTIDSFPFLDPPSVPSRNVQLRGGNTSYEGSTRSTRSGQFGRMDYFSEDSVCSGASSMVCITGGALGKSSSKISSGTPSTAATSYQSEDESLLMM